MALSQKLELRQSQSLVMTPQLMQAIKLLQLSNLDLVAYVDAELERNPLLERAEADDEGPETADGDRDSAELNGAGENGEEAPEWLQTRLESDADVIEGKLDTDLANVFPDDHGHASSEVAPALPAETWSVAPSRLPVSSEDYNLEAFVAGEKSLADHLSDQLGLTVDDPRDRLIGFALINEIDEAGYIRADLEGISERLGAPITDVERVLAVVQSFEPTGVGARNLPECLAIQLRERDRLDPAMTTLLANLELVARRDLAALMRICGVDAEDLAEMLAEVRALNPKPGNAIGRTVVQPVIPDALVRPTPDGGWHVELNTDTLPRVLVNQTYFARVAKSPRNDADRAYITDCLQNGQLAGKKPRPARQDDPQGGNRDRPPAGCLPCGRRPASPSA